MNIHWLINPHGGFLNDYPGIHPPNSYSSSPTFHHLSIWLVVSTPLKNMSPSVGVTIPNMWKVIIQPCSKPPASFPSFIHGSSPSFPTFSHWNPTFSNRWGNPTVARHPPTPRCSWRSVAPRAGTGTFHRGRFKIWKLNKRENMGIWSDSMGINNDSMGNTVMVV